jgi:hypothetical protein
MVEALKLRIEEGRETCVNIQPPSQYESFHTLQRIYEIKRKCVLLPESGLSLCYLHISDQKGSPPPENVVQSHQESSS